MRFLPTTTLAALGLAFTVPAVTASAANPADDGVVMASDAPDASYGQDYAQPTGYSTPVLPMGAGPGPIHPYSADAMDCYGCPPSGNAFAEGWHAPPQCSRAWVNFEYLYWQPKGINVPALVTTSPVRTAQTVAGELGQPTTSVLYGDGEINDDYRAGGRLQGGFWLAPDEMAGIEGHVFSFDDEQSVFTANGSFSNGGAGPILARPFFNVDSALQDTLLLAYPDFVTGNQTIDLDGSVDVRSESEIQSAGVLFRRISWMDVLDSSGVSFVRIYGLIGYRYFNLDEQLSIDSTIRPIGGSFGNNSSVRSSDLFDTENEFHGGELGIDTQINRGSFFLKILTKAALGNTHQTVNIAGSTVSSDGVNSTTFAGGLLAQPTNIGEITSDHFSVLPEGNITVGCQLTRNVAVTGGYSFLYLSNVVRPGDQIDFSVNPTQFDGGVLIGEARPTASINHDDFWMHGFNAGVEVTW
ncbi:MAG: BBP7 family outer membrane beta-barrel protein [Planctomycetia bacterium]|nr:BBP7 family outer membrane beta-barrel protein [Planctomycetia bacterium]